MGSGIEIKYIHDEDMIFYCKGHVSPQDFNAALLDQHCHQVLASKTEWVSHGTWRAMPDPDCRACYHDAMPGSRGSFPVTWVEKAACFKTSPCEVCGKGVDIERRALWDASRASEGIVRARHMGCEHKEQP